MMGGRADTSKQCVSSSAHEIVFTSFLHEYVYLTSCQMSCESVGLRICFDGHCVYRHDESCNNALSKRPAKLYLNYARPLTPHTPPDALAGWEFCSNGQDYGIVRDGEEREW